MTDKDIIKALECCCKNNNCEGCPLDYLTFSSQCASELAIKSLDVITRQQKEIEKLKVENQSLRTAANSLKMHYEEAQAEIENYKHLDVILHTAIDKLTANIKSEAVKEFCEKRGIKYVEDDV